MGGRGGRKKRYFWCRRRQTVNVKLTNGNLCMCLQRELCGSINEEGGVENVPNHKPTAPVSSWFGCTTADNHCMHQAAWLRLQAQRRAMQGHTPDKQSLPTMLITYTQQETPHHNALPPMSLGSTMTDGHSVL